MRINNILFSYGLVLSSATALIAVTLIVQYLDRLQIFVIQFISHLEDPSILSLAARAQLYTSYLNRNHNRNVERPSRILLSSKTLLET
jgi:hypothetical protein